jgi:DNA-directed RNA polymerase subunit L
VENKGKDIMDVCAGDIKVYMRNPENPLDKPIQLESSRFFPPDPITGNTALITRLRPQWNPTALNERIQLKAKASVSTGIENIRWSPVCQSSYEYTRDTNPEHEKAVFIKWLESHKKISDVNTVDAERLESLDAEFKTMEIQRCYLTNEKGDPNDFTFHVESIGIQNVYNIVRSALISCEVLVSKYQDIDGLLPENVRIQNGDSGYGSFDVIFKDESHTLGNLLETWIIENEISEGSEITYAGYKVPHPLRPEMYVRIGYRNHGNEDHDVKQQQVRRVIAKAARALKETFRGLLAQWNAQFSESTVGQGTIEQKSDS